MSRCRFVYPQLPLERIIQLLNQVATVTKTDLTEPNSDFITNIFPPILVYIHCLREDHRLVEFADLEQLNSPDMHVDSVKMINLYHTIKKVIAALDCPEQFNLKDIVKPEADRTEFFFSTILNFCVHSEHIMNKLQPMVGEIKVLAYQVRELDERISQLNDEISELNEAKEREMPFVQEIATKIKEMQQEITALNNLHSLKITISKASTEMDQKISSADLALKRTAEENRSLHFKFVQPLDKLQRTLEERKIAQVEAKDAERATMQSSHEQTATDEAYTKMESSNAKAEKNVFMWTDQSVLDLCDLLNGYIMRNGRSSAFKWNELQLEFEELVHTKLKSYKVLKNKYCEMKKDYSLWTSLKNGATGIGWNAATKKIECSYEWWDKKMQENKNVKKLWKKQPSLELQEAWYSLFGDSVSNGVDCVSSAMDQNTFNEADRVNKEDEDDPLTGDDEDDPLTSDHVENSEGQKDTFFSDFIDVVNKEKVPTTMQSGGPKQSQKSSKMTTKPIQMKRKGRESKGSALFKDLIIQQNATQQRALKILESDVSCVNQVGNASVSEAMSVINSMVNKGLMTKGDKLWCFAMTLFEDVVKRELFLNMPDDDGRMAWLKYKHDGGN